MRTGNFTALTVLLLAFGLPQHAMAEESQSPSDALYQNAAAAGVEILIEDRHAGSGCFVSDEGLVLTAAHLFAKPDRRTEILSPTVGRRDAKLIAIDKGRDLALLQVAAREDPFPAIALAAEMPKAGQSVFQFGAPLFRSGTLQAGMIARPAERFEYYGDRKHYVGIVHVAAMMQPGTSGGAWLNANGELWGVQSGVMRENNAICGIAFAGPLEPIRRLVETGKSASTPTLGLAAEETWQQDEKYWKRFPPRTEGLVVRNVHQDGPAARAGIEMWDVIRQIDGQKVSRVEELLTAVRAKQPGDEVVLELLHPDGKGTSEKRAQLGKLEIDWP
jgi:serine protease Do